MQAPTSDQIRNDIDTGATGEKVAMPDPAAAPLGTDAEAAGTPPTAQQRTLARDEAPQRPEGSRRAIPGGAIYLALVLLLAAIIVSIIFLALP